MNIVHKKYKFMELNAFYIFLQKYHLLFWETLLLHVSNDESIPMDNRIVLVSFGLYIANCRHTVCGSLSLFGTKHL